jgi:hypothetical protein
VLPVHERVIFGCHAAQAGVEALSVIVGRRRRRGGGGGGGGEKEREKKRKLPLPKRKAFAFVAARGS